MEEKYGILEKGVSELNTENDKVLLEIEYENGNQKFNIRLFITRALQDIRNGLSYILVPFGRKNNKIDLNNTCIYHANNGMYLTSVKKRKTHDDLHMVHRHFVDVVTGTEFCEYSECKGAVPSKGSKHGIVDSPINYITGEEYVRINSHDISNKEKLYIIYSILQRANAKYLEEQEDLPKTK